MRSFKIKASAGKPTKKQFSVKASEASPDIELRSAEKKYNADFANGPFACAEVDGRGYIYRDLSDSYTYREIVLDEVADTFEAAKGAVDEWNRQVEDGITLSTKPKFNAKSVKASASAKRRKTVKAASRPTKKEYITKEFVAKAKDSVLTKAYENSNLTVMLLDGTDLAFVAEGPQRDTIEDRAKKAAKKCYPEYGLFDTKSGKYISQVKASVIKKRQQAVKASDLGNSRPLTKYTERQVLDAMNVLGYHPWGPIPSRGVIQFSNGLGVSSFKDWKAVEEELDHILENGVGRGYTAEEQEWIPEVLEDILVYGKRWDDKYRGAEYEVDASTKTVKASSSAKKRKAIKAGRSKLISKDKWTVDTASRYSLHNSRTGDIENSNSKASLIRKCKNLTDPAWVEDNMLGGIIFNNKAQNQADFEAIDPPFNFPVESATSRRTVKASDYRDDDIVMYFNGENVFTGSIYDLADAVENLCYDEEVNAKFMEWCNQFGDPFDFDGSPIDTARTFADIVIHEADEGPVTDDGTTQFYVDGDGILNFEIFYANDGIYSATNIKCNDGIAPDDYGSVEDMISDGGYDYNGYDDSDLLENVDQYFRRFDDIWLNTDFVSYNGPDDWSVDASLSSDGVGSDFNYFLEDNFPDLYETLNTSYTTEPDDYHDSYSYDLLDVLVPNDFSIQFYPSNNQFSAPQIDFDTKDKQLKAKLEEARSAYESSRITAYKNLQNGLGEYLASGIIASTNIKCAKSLDLNARNNWDEWVLYGYDINGADVDTRVIDFQDNVRDAVGELFAWPEVDTVDLYKRGPADYDGEYFNTITRADYEGGNIEASTDITAGIDIGKKHDYSNSIYDLSGYVRMLSDEVLKHIDDDISVTVTDEAITFTQNGEVVYIQPTEEIIPEPDDLESDAEELATAVGSVLYDKAMREDFDNAWDATYDEDYATRTVEFSTDADDDLEPITGTASAEDRIFDIITDKLRSSELAEFGDVDLLNGDADIKIHSNGADLDYIIAFVGDPATIGFEDRFMKYVKNPNYNDLNADSITNLATEIVVEDGTIKSVNFVNLDDNDLTNYDITAYEDFIRKMAEPTVSEIYTFIDEAVNDGSIQASIDPNLEPITGEDDFGFGFDSNGEAVSESMVDELERIAQEILDKSNLCKEIDQYASIKQFNYYASVPYIQESFFITFTYTADYYELSERDVLYEDGWYSTNGDYEFNFNVYCKNGEVEYAECLGLSPKDVKMFSVDRLELFAERLVAPVASEIYNSTTNI